MSLSYAKKKRRQNKVFYAIITTLLICAVFFSMFASFYSEAKEEAYEMLHIQTKQIKDDLTLQIKSDRENLVTMANFAAKLYADGEDYQRMFDSFKPIGLFSNIGILNPDNTFATKVGTVDLNGKISFADEAAKGVYISGRVEDLTGYGREIIRSAVPIVSNGETVGILYGVIHLRTIGEKYTKMAKELDAQLFVYNKQDAKFLIDTINREPGTIKQLKNREFVEGHTYEDLVTTDKGYTVFKSVFKNENLYAHYSTLEDFHWGIMLARYESQVFQKTHDISKSVLLYFILGIVIIALYLLSIMSEERSRSTVATRASGIRKLLLEVNQQHGNVAEALKMIQEFSLSRTAFFVNTDGDDYHYVSPSFKGNSILGENVKFFVCELFKYASDLHNTNNSTLGFMRITPNKHLAKINKELYDLLKEYKIDRVSFATITDKNKRISILGVVNTIKPRVTRELLEEVAVCFSIAIFNKKHLNKTEVAATTDSLTGALNRVSYKRDILVLDEEKPEDFACIYIDVNELHLRNNKYGHAAGDEMLIYIANALMEVFSGHTIYRMGGDEFLVFVKNVSQDEAKDGIEAFINRLETTDYKVAIGMSYRKRNVNCEEMVREAELRMYEAKAQYYQSKEKSSVAKDADDKYIHVNTGIREIDTMISILKEHYNGIYRVSLNSDDAHRILMPSYLGYNEYESNFSNLLSKYIDDIVHPDFHRAVMSFLNYDAIKRQLAEGLTPRIVYKKANGETVVLSIYSLSNKTNDIDETLWVFAKG